jgi:hypothetical protein
MTILNKTVHYGEFTAFKCDGDGQTSCHLCHDINWTSVMYARVNNDATCNYYCGKCLDALSEVGVGNRPVSEREEQLKKILDEKQITEIEADEIPELFPQHAETHNYSAARLKLGNYLYDLECGIRSRVLDDAQLIVNRIHGYVLALIQVMKLSPSDAHELEEYAERNIDYLRSIINRYKIQERR